MALAQPSRMSSARYQTDTTRPHGRALRSRVRSVQGSIAAGVLALLSAGCAVDVASSEWSAAIAGPWVLPRDVREAGEAQFIAYDSPPPWDGGANCGDGLLEGTRQIGNFLVARYPQIDHYGGYNCRQNSGNPSQTSVHGTGRALDLMLPLDGGEADNGKGDPIANWLVVHAREIGVQYIIWDRWDWLGSLSGRKDTSYGGPHPHHDHIHMELTHEGAARMTAWFDDRDGDGIANARDNCDTVANRMQEDRDSDGVGNACDNCPGEDNPRQADEDADGVGNVCDNCARVDNAGQMDTDGDGRGDRCDNCDGVDNPGQVDTDGDMRGDACDTDDDGDTIADDVDNCRIVANEGQSDRDGDGRGDRCDGDDDGDTVADDTDNCPGRPNTDQLDRDGDGRGDACDDADGDGVFDALDVCPDVSDAPQADLDGDGAGDACDDDRDGDGVGDASDVCRDVADDQADLDGDAIGDACDPDADGDDVLDDVDLCHGLADDQTDSDLDGLGDACDPDPDVSDDPDPGPAHDDDPDDTETPREMMSGCSAAPRSSLPWWLALGVVAWIFRKRYP